MAEREGDLTSEAAALACRYCGAPIHPDASVCATCRYRQSPAWNILRQLAWVVAFVAFVAVCAAFVGERLSGLIEDVTWRDDVALVAFAEDAAKNHRVVFSNTGDGRVLISSILVHHQLGTVAIQVNLDVEPGRAAIFNDVSAGAGDKSWRILLSEDGRLPDNVRARMVNGDKCFAFGFTEPDSILARQLAELYKNANSQMVLEDATAQVDYFSPHDQRMMSSEFPLKMVIYADAACAGSAGEVQTAPPE